MFNGSLQKHIYSDNSKLAIGCDMFLKIAIGIAQGLEYLQHSLLKPYLINPFKYQAKKIISKVLHDEDYLPRGLKVEHSTTQGRPWPLRNADYITVSGLNSS
jgi:hypothetical protein